MATDIAPALPDRSAGPKLKRELGVRDLTLFAIACITSARWIPIAAHAGASSITLWLMAALFFAVPLTIAVAALVRKYPDAGGLYVWTREDFGPWHGFLSFWLYWIAIACLFPSATLLYMRISFALLGPKHAALGDNRAYLLGATLVAVWIAIGSNTIGVKVGKWTENLGAIATWIVGVLLIVVACMTWMRRGSATAPQIIPTWNWSTVNFWAAIAFAMSGMECPGMMAGEMRDPEHTMRRAGWIATAFATLFYIAATGAFLVVLPAQKISELNGYAEVGDSAGRLLGTPWLSPVLALLVLLGGVGLLGGMGASASRLPFAAGVDGLLPKAFAKIHPRWGTPYISMIVLGLTATALLVMSQLGDTLSAAYDELISMMVINGFVPYVYVFGSAWKAGKRISVLSGLAITIIAVICSVVPPTEVRNVWLFEGKIVLGTFGIAGVGWLVYRRSLSKRSS
jgi:glutamate:GABA antiporter